MKTYFNDRLKFTFLALIICLFVPTSGFCDEEFTYYHTDVEFRHYIHVEGQGIACDACHSKLKNGVYKMLGHDVCVSCHRESIEVFEITEHTCGVCHKSIEKVGDEFKIPLRMGNKPRNILSHTKALEGICFICHGDMLDEIVDIGIIRTEAGRFRVRERAHRFHFAAQCEKCHEGFSPDAAPDNHTDDWNKKHTKVAPTFNCRICHTKSYCQSCHIDVY
nr:hypothetical protein [Desulfobulbaceae bacterium]